MASSIGLAFGARDYYGDGRPAGARRRGRGRPDPGPRRRGAGRGGHRPPRQRRPPRRLEPGVHRLQPRLPRRRRARRLRPVDADGAVLPARLERGRGARTAATSSRCSPPSGWPPRSTTASRPPSSTGRSRAGSTASRAGPPTAPATSCAPTASTTRSTPLAARSRTSPCPAARAPSHRCEMENEGPAAMEECFYDALLLVRQARGAGPAHRRGHGRPPGRGPGSASTSAHRGAARRPRPGSTRSTSSRPPADAPAELALEPGSVTTLRGAARQGAPALQPGLRRRAAGRRGRPPRLHQRQRRWPPDMGEGYWNAARQPPARTLSIGGICEDAMAGILSGLVVLRPPHRRRVLLRGLPRAPRPRRRPPPRHRLPGEGPAGALAAHDPRLRPRRAEDRRGRPHPRRPPGRSSSCRRTSRGARRSPSPRGTRRRSGRSWPRRCGTGRR